MQAYAKPMFLAVQASYAGFGFGHVDGPLFW
jgi:hypothetical protein